MEDIKCNANCLVFQILLAGIVRILRIYCNINFFHQITPVRLLREAIVEISCVLKRSRQENRYLKYISQKKVLKFT